MWIFDTLKNALVKTGNYLETTGTKIVSHLPGWATLSTKAGALTKKAVNEIGLETKDMIAEGKELAGKVGDKIADAWHTVAQKAKEVGHTAAEKAKEAWHIAADKIAETAHDVRDSIVEKVTHHTEQPVTDPKATTPSATNETATPTPGATTTAEASSTIGTTAPDQAVAAVIPPVADSSSTVVAEATKDATSDSHDAS